jgi:hypothetical protein
MLYSLNKIFDLNNHFHCPQQGEIFLKLGVKFGVYWYQLIDENLI